MPSFIGSSSSQKSWSVFRLDVMSTEVQTVQIVQMGTQLLNVLNALNALDD